MRDRSGGCGMLAGATMPPLRWWRARPLLESFPLLGGREPFHWRHECRGKEEEEEAGGMEEEMSNGGSAPLPIYSQREANRRPPRSQVMMVFLHVAGTHQVGQLPRQRGEAETPTSCQSPRVNQGRKLLGPAALRT